MENSNRNVYILIVISNNMVSKKESSELKKLKNQDNQPKDEEKIVPLVKNGDQFKVAIPKKFSDILRLHQDKNKAEFILHKKERKLTMEVIKWQKKKYLV